MKTLDVLPGSEPLATEGSPLACQNHIVSEWNSMRALFTRCGKKKKYTIGVHKVIVQAHTVVVKPQVLFSLDFKQLDICCSGSSSLHLTHSFFHRHRRSPAMNFLQNCHKAENFVICVFVHVNYRAWNHKSTVVAPSFHPILMMLFIPGEASLGSAVNIYFTYFFRLSLRRLSIPRLGCGIEMKWKKILDDSRIYDRP